MSQKFRARISALIAELEKRTQGDNSGCVVVECEHPEQLATPNPSAAQMAETARRGLPVVHVRFISSLTEEER